MDNPVYGAPPKKEHFKKRVRLLAKVWGLKPTQAHEKYARMFGFKTYNAYLAWEKDKYD